MTEQLKELERDKLVDRKYYKEIPPRVEYSIRELGKSLIPLFKEMAKWNDEHILSKY